MRTRFFLCLICLGVLLLTGSSPVHAQEEGVLFLNSPVHHFLERQYALGHLPEATLSHRPLSAYEAQRYLDSLALAPDALTRVDRQLLARYRGTAPGPGAQTARRLVPFAYRNGRNVISVSADDYGFEIDPLLYLTYGQAQQTQIHDRDATVPTWQNTRGVRAAGHIGKYVFFEARLEENQRRSVQPEFAINTAPRIGNTKFDGEVYDYFIATGVVGVRSKYFEARFGKTRNHWGYGEGSLALSNFPTVYDQLQLRTTVWRFQYTNLFIGRAMPTRASASSFVPRLYGAMHHLEITLPGRVRLELYESVMFASSDSTGRRDDGFEISYMNPVIFLRAADAERGSPDNVLLGTGLSWIPYPGIQIYTQFMIDELRFEEIGNQWWGNKWGWLAGLYLVDLPLPNLSARFEFARLRPYFYAHRTANTAYVHYRDLLGHPVGPNAIDWAFFLDYQPVERVRAAFNVAYTQRGRNPEGENVGGDPLLPTTTRASNRNVAILQGVRQTQWLVEGHVGFELLPELYAGAALALESVDDEATGLDRYVAPMLMLRWGLPFQSLRY
jgi:hypothetical protein